MNQRKESRKFSNLQIDTTPVILFGRVVREREAERLICRLDLTWNAIEVGENAATDRGYSRIHVRDHSRCSLQAAAATAAAMSSVERGKHAPKAWSEWQ
ncbi:hypothetical protein K0M31_012226 [Melipona bicolor]|uniref:Uncharacterized protein n=1 Tax=Melipona bicolor TaxID=60889 RepID=A0AA40FKK9_9HYME|nr:hypothetical protein K0M31_012226 [Melipona bicolor]